ncbi:MAG: arylsulfotransferase family protein, partial [Alphaproteobacteria bacterium]
LLSKGIFEMRIFWSIFGIIAVYLMIIFTGVFMPSIYNSFFNTPIHNYRTIYVQTFHTYGAEFFYRPARTDQEGVTIHNPDKAYQGYTFLISADKNEARLIDMEGNIVHSWQKDAEIVWGISDIPGNKENMYIWTRGTLIPRSGQVYINTMTLDTLAEKYPGTMVLDEDSNIIRNSSLGSHHDIAIAPNGDAYILTGRLMDRPDADFPHIIPPFIDEGLAVVSADGTLKKEISFWELFKNSDLKIVLERLQSKPLDPVLPEGDIFHTNSISFVPDAAIGKAPMLKEGHIMVSFRNLDLMVMIDPENEEITWASYGPWKGQHSPQILDDGTMLLFDNLGNLKEGGASRILRIDLNDLSIVWEYAGTKENPLHSWHSSHVKLLPNGNILITEAEGGRILEVTPEKEIVWEYIVPARYKFEEDDPDLIPVVFSGARFTKDELGFLD